MMGSILILILIVLAVGASSTMVMNKKEPNVAHRFFSITAVTEKLLLLGKRFPISVLLVIGLAVLSFIAVNGDFDDISYQLWVFFSIGAFISITATLFAEDFWNNLKIYGITLIAVLLWGIYCIFLPEDIDDFKIAKGIEMFVISAAVSLAMFFVSFLKKNKDHAFWNFSTQTILQIALASVFSGILFGGLSVAFLAVEGLFDVSIDGEVYGNLAVVCFALFAPLYFLANIPDKTEKHGDEMLYSKIQKILALYILTPILAVYAVILYAYLFKIIVAWELPVGWVSWLVSALALGGLFVITFLFPVREQENNKVVNFISRWFGLLILPLLVLMTVGIFRRIGDYGITINRGYVLLLNLWFYGIYIYLFLTNSKHIKWILISLVSVALLTSVSVFGVATATKISLTKEVSAVLNKPMTSEEARAIFSEMTQEEKARMKSALEYLHEHFGKESVQPFFTDTVSGSYWNWLSELDLRDALDDITIAENEWFSFNANNENSLNIEKYNTFLPKSYSRWNTNNNIDYSVEEEVITITSDNHNFSIPMREIVLEHLKSERKEWIIEGENYTFWISEFSGDYYQAQDSIEIQRFEGYLFYKK